MGVIAKDTGTGGDFEPVPQGTHKAICNMVVDLGVQETTYMGATTNKHQVYIRWELPEERIEYTDPRDGKEKEGPRVVGKTYTLSLNEKANLRKDLEAWRGKAFTESELDGFDLLNLLGVPCFVTVTHRHKDDRTYANVTGIAGWPKGLEKPAGPENPILKYSHEDTEDFESLPEWLQKKIMAQIMPRAINGNGPPDPDPPPVELDDEIPF